MRTYDFYGSNPGRASVLPDGTAAGVVENDTPAALSGHSGCPGRGKSTTPRILQVTPETATFAVHHKTGEPLPAELARELYESRYKSSVSATMRMLRHAKLDLEINLYFHEKFKGRPLDEVAAELLAPWQLPYSAPTPSDMRSVHHTMNPGYAASFYTYIWSEAMSMDAFSRFKAEGILNPATGAAYRKCILEPGGSKPALELFRDFMGREPDSKAFILRFNP